MKIVAYQQISFLYRNDFFSLLVQIASNHTVWKAIDPEEYSIMKKHLQILKMCI